MNSIPIEIVTLDKRVLNIAMDEIISPKTIKKINNEGLPIPNIYEKDKQIDPLEDKNVDNEGKNIEVIQENNKENIADITIQKNKLNENSFFFNHAGRKNTKGDLYIKFDIRFPKYIKQDVKDDLEALLKDC